MRVRVLNDEQPDNNTSETRWVVATGVYVYIDYCLFWEIFAYFGLKIDVHFCNIIAIDGGGWCVCVCPCLRVAVRHPGRARPPAELQFKKSRNFLHVNTILT